MMRAAYYIPALVRCDDRVRRRTLAFFSKAWPVFLLSNIVAVACLRLRFAVFGSVGIWIAGLVLLCVGLVLRWWSIACLGRLFTVDVAIAPDHGVVDSGRGPGGAVPAAGAEADGHR